MKTNKQTNKRWNPCKREGLRMYIPTGEYYSNVRVNGEVMQICLHTTSQKEAVTRLRKEIAKREQLACELGTVESVCAIFLARKNSKGLSQRRFKLLQRLTFSLRDQLGKKKCEEVTEDDIIQWIKSFKGIKPRTRNDYLQCAHTIFDIAKKKNWCRSNPVDDVERSIVNKSRRPCPNYDEFKKIVNQIRTNPTDHAEESANFVWLMGEAGLGLAETAALSWEDFDWDAAQIHIQRKKTGRNFIIPFFPQIRTLIESLREKANSPKFGKVFSIGDPRRALKTACRRLSLPNYTSRDFRRMFITRLIVVGVDIRAIARWQGHRDGGALLLKTYAAEYDAAQSKRELEKLRFINDSESEAAA